MDVLAAALRDFILVVLVSFGVALAIILTAFLHILFGKEKR
ncbi:hypothetical protein [Anaeroselena agilis]|uniref:NADH dehydrogenase subunit 1 n=1 Tax=Anaeroselena agilis TaxID=3063788 RepID=A0ABU3NV18_9FIRM|nr:hypothetical protein [Selenomonadales bacterium 4137-cl]